MCICYVVMPNHFHGIIEITNVWALRTTPKPVRQYARTDNKNEYMSSISPKCGDLATIVRAFKSATTKQIKQINSLTNKKIWQRNYYESIIHKQDDYAKVSSYIINNPRNWGKYKFYIK